MDYSNELASTIEGFHGVLGGRAAERKLLSRACGLRSSGSGLMSVRAGLQEHGLSVFSQIAQCVHLQAGHPEVHHQQVWHRANHCHQLHQEEFEDHDGVRAHQAGCF